MQGSCLDTYQLTIQQGGTFGHHKGGRVVKEHAAWDVLLQQGLGTLPLHIFFKRVCENLLGERAQ